MRILVLIISNDSEPIYAEHRKVWREYMIKSHQDFECYFITSNPDIQSSYLDGDTFRCKAKEVFRTIVQKTSEAIDYFTARQSYDYVLRTNLSSVWIFKNLVPILDALSRRNLIFGVIGIEFGRKFVSGSGILMTPDVADMVSKNWRNYDYEYDDLTISNIAEDRGVVFQQGSRRDLLSDLQTLENTNLIQYNHYHFRIKSTDIQKRYEEPEKMVRILQANGLLPTAV